MKNNAFSVIGFDRHRLGTDGKGVTTLIGLSGCPLNCKYCINKDVLVKDSFQIEFLKLLQKVMQDYCYFVATDGGVTFGGGEPLLHYKQIKEFINILPKHISINIETSLNIESIAVEELLKDINEWIIDIKDMNSLIYKKYTGESNNLVLQNLKYISDKGYQNRCTIRVPLIYKYNTEMDRNISVSYLKEMGFENFDLFEYKIF